MCIYNIVHLLFKTARVAQWLRRQTQVVERVRASSGQLINFIK